MSLFPAIEVLLAEQGRKYILSDQVGGLREMMLDLKAKGEATCQEFRIWFENFRLSIPSSVWRGPVIGESGSDFTAAFL